METGIEIMGTTDNDGNLAPPPPPFDPGVFASCSRTLSSQLPSAHTFLMPTISSRRWALKHSDVGCVVTTKFLGKEKVMNYVGIDLLTKSNWHGLL